MANPTLQDLVSGKNYDTDKSERYLSHYQDYFGLITGNDVKLLELGVLKGGSLMLWRDYFPKGTIAGLDLNLIGLDDPTGRIRIYQGLQQDTKLLTAIAREVAPGGFDIIIDDASHVGELTRTAFLHLFEHHLKPGGIYVIEDWRTGYYRNFVDGRRYSGSRGAGLLRQGFQKWIDSLTRRVEASVRENPGSAGFLKKVLQRIRKMSAKRRFKSHDYGMVGFVKELVDELGRDIITSPVGGGSGEQQECKLLSLEFFPGQVFVVKNTEA